MHESQRSFGLSFRQPVHYTACPAFSHRHQYQIFQLLKSDRNSFWTFFLIVDKWWEIIFLKQWSIWILAELAGVCLFLTEQVPSAKSSWCYLFITFFFFVNIWFMAQCLNKFYQTLQVTETGRVAKEGMSLWRFPWINGIWFELPNYSQECRLYQRRIYYISLSCLCRS